MKEIANNFPKILKEAAHEVGGKKKYTNHCKIPSKTKNLVEKRRNLKLMSPRDKIKSVDPTKAINKKKE